MEGAHAEAHGVPIGLRNRGVRLLLGVCAAAALLVSPTVSGDELPVVSRVRFHPAPGRPEQMVGGRFLGSNQGETVGFVELARVRQAPPEGEWSELAVDAPAAFRYLKYEGPDGSHGTVAEVEFYDGEQRLRGEPFGVAGAREKGRDYGKALDGDTATYFDAFLADGAYVGIDLGIDGTVLAPVSFSPAPGRYDGMQVVSLSSATPGARIRYTADGANPSSERGLLYREPLDVREGTTALRAIALKQGMFPSPVRGAVYTIGRAPAPEGYTTFHIGNSLTDTIVGWLEPVAESAGYDHDFHRFTIPGAPTDWLWNHPGQGFGEPNYPRAFPRLAPIDHLSTQPFAGHGRSIENEAEHSGRFYELCRETSPNVRLWLYQQWPNREPRDRWAMARGEDVEALGLEPAETWEQGVRNHLAYFEALRKRMDAEHGGPPVLIVPAGLVMLNLKRAIEAGEVPGIDRFFETHYGEGDRGPGYNIHMIAKGRYMVSLVFYCCIYQEPPDRVSLPREVTTLTSEQDAIYKRIAWETVRGYRWAGIPAERRGQ